MKALIKLALTAMFVYAAWNAANAWVSYFKFKDAIAETTQYGAGLSEEQLKEKVMALAAEYSIPLEEDAVTIRRDDQQHTMTDGHYDQSIVLFPGYARPFTFTWHTDTFVIAPPPGSPVH
jgi:hypothetical protein